METRPGRTLTPRLLALRPQAATTLGSAGAPRCGADAGVKGAPIRLRGSAAGQHVLKPAGCSTEGHGGPQTGPVPSQDAVQRQEDAPGPPSKHSRTHTTRT